MMSHVHSNLSHVNNTPSSGSEGQGCVRVMSENGWRYVRVLWGLGTNRENVGLRKKGRLR
jgi:hypothetical protein